MTLRFECDFGHPETGERETISVELNADEVAAIKEMRDRADKNAEVYMHAYALRYAYPKRKKGFLHVSAQKNGIRAVAVN